MLDGFKVIIAIRVFAIGYMSSLYISSDKCIVILSDSVLSISVPLHIRHLLHPGTHYLFNTVRNIPLVVFATFLPPMYGEIVA